MLQRGQCQCVMRRKDVKLGVEVAAFRRDWQAQCLVQLSARQPKTQLD